MDKIALQPHGRLKLHGRKQESSITGDRNHFFAWTDEAGCNGPRQGHTKGLLSIRDQKLARPETVEIAGEPNLEGAHVGTQGYVVAHQFL